MRQVLVIALVCLLTGPGLADAAEWRVVSSDSRELLVEVDVTGAQLVEVPVGGQIYHRVEVPGTTPVGDPGLPMLPALSTWVLLPPGGTATATVEVLERSHLGPARVMPMPTPRRAPVVELGAPRLVETVEEAEGYDSFATASSDLLRLGQPTWMRRQAMAPLSIRPVIYTAAGGTVTVVTRLRVRIRFQGERLAVPKAPGNPDPVVLRGVLNPEMAPQWRADSPDHRAKRERWSELRPVQKRRAGVTPLDATALLSHEIRLRVDSTGFFRIRASDLINNLGLSASTLRRDLRLYQKRPSDPQSADYPLPLTADVPLAFIGNPDPDAALAPSDVLVFYGFHPRDDLTARDVDGQVFPAAMPERMDNWNSENVYYLAAVDRGGGDDWKRMSMETPAASTGSPPPFFRWSETFEADAGYQDNPADRDQQRYHFNDPVTTEVTTAIELRSPVAGSTIDVSWSTGTYTFKNDRTMLFELVKGQTVAQLATVNMSTSFYHRFQTLTGSVPADDFGAGFSTFRMTRLGGANMAAMLGSVSVDYDAEAVASFDQAFIRTGQVGGDVDVEISGFTRDDLLMFDVTDPRQPSQVNPIVVPDGGGGFNVEVRLTQGGGVERQLTVLPLIRIELLRPADMEAALDPLLIDPTGSSGVLGPSQVLAIGPAQFRDPMQPWLTWRRDRDTFGWAYSYVDVQHIYDQFSGGVKSPTAIKAATEYAYVMWDAKAIVLVGDANENSRGIGVTPGIDLVPTTLHISDVLTEYELLASDKWYGLFGTDSGYPGNVTKGPDMMVGRLPAGNLGELNAVLNKIFEYETPSADDDWRRRSLWVSDDAYSTNYFQSAESCYRFISSELAFQTSQTNSANQINSCFDAAFEAQTWHLNTFTEPYRESCPGEVCDCESSVRNRVAQEARPDFVRTLDQGWLIVSYQGHASYQRLAHETMFDRSQIPLLNNPGRYYLFFGMGCHVTDFVQAREGGLTPGETNAWGPPLGEQILERAGAGAIATYGSSGFEFLQPNRAFMDLIADNFFCRSRSASPILDGALVSQWILSEQLAQSELEIIANLSSQYREMMAQYNLLGDPLLRMDAAPPRMTLSADGNGVADGAELLPAVGTSTIALALDIVDEAGVERVVVTDDQGRDYSGQIQFVAPDSDPRQRSAALDLPIHAQGYTVTVDTYDGSYPLERPSTLSFTIPFELTVQVDGLVVSEDEGPVGPGSDLSVEFTSPVALLEAQIVPGLDGGTLRNVSTQALDADSRQWRVDAEVATVDAEVGQTLTLALAGAVTRFDFTSSAGPGDDTPAVAAHFPYPNPTPGPVRFAVDASGSVTWARISVYDVSGRRLHHSEATGLTQNMDGDVVLAWDGRDNQGDELANGVYFYRIELGGDSGSAKSDMGRIVLMR